MADKDDSIEPSRGFEKAWEDIRDEFYKYPAKFIPPQHRVVDLYDRDELGLHLRRFMEHCMAKGVNPELPVVLDWLYSKKAFNERDDFVKIERLMEMVKDGMVYPMLILEVLDYAKRVEEAAMDVVAECGAVEGIDSIDKLRAILDTRLEIRRNDDESKSKKQSKKDQN